MEISVFLPDLKRSVWVYCQIDSYKPLGQNIYDSVTNQEIDFDSLSYEDQLVIDNAIQEEIAFEMEMSADYLEDR